MKAIHILSIALLLTTGGAAAFGGGSMLIDPTGSSLGLSADVLNRSPFDNFLIPGLILFLTVGVLGIVTAVLTILKHDYAARLTVLQGAILTGWIGVQSILLQMMDPIQIVVGGIGLTLFCLGLFEAAEDTVVHENDLTA